MIDLTKLEIYRENNRIEAKKAVGGLPKSIWETYSAFANTMGGVILLGVEERKDKSFHAVGLSQPQRLVDEFVKSVNDKNMASANVLRKDSVRIEETNGKKLIVIEVPRAKRKDMPVYVGGNLWTGAYMRNGEGDYRCCEKQVKSMLRCAEPKRTAQAFIKGEIVEYITESVYATEKELEEVLEIKHLPIKTALLELVGKGVLIYNQESGEYSLKS